MTKRAISKAQLSVALQLDRFDIAVSTLMPTDTWHFEAEFTAGRISDIHCYQRKKAVDGSYSPWVLVCSVPSIQVKAYTWSESDIPTNLVAPKVGNAEPEAEVVEGDPGSARKAGSASLRG